jgi:hypothetical protein
VGEDVWERGNWVCGVASRLAGWMVSGSFLLFPWGFEYTSVDSEWGRWLFLFFPYTLLTTLDRIDQVFCKPDLLSQCLPLFPKCHTYICELKKCILHMLNCYLPSRLASRAIIVASHENAESAVGRRPSSYSSAEKNPSLMLTLNHPFERDPTNRPPRQIWNSQLLVMEVQSRPS